MTRNGVTVDTLDLISADELVDGLRDGLGEDLLRDAETDVLVPILARLT